MVQAMFGGSVKRGTYVNGLSDVDVFLIMNKSSLVNQQPATVIQYVKGLIERRLPRIQVRVGNLAVTVCDADGAEFQILPAIRRKSGEVRIAEPGSTTWSNVVQPENFVRKLIEVNRSNSGRVVPTIKLAKAIADCFIRRPSRKIEGYHMESIAIEAFGYYQGARGPKTMLNHLLRTSTTVVMNPIVDSTGQSSYVDEYLGPAKSRCRRRASTYFGQIRREFNTHNTRQELDNLSCEESATK